MEKLVGSSKFFCLGIEKKRFFEWKKGPLLTLRALGFLESMGFCPASFFKRKFLGLFSLCIS